MQGIGQQYKADPEPPAPHTHVRDLNQDPSLDTIFYAAWTGAGTFGVARYGLEFSKITSVGLGALAGLVVYGQFWRIAVQNVRNVAGQWGTVTRQEPVDLVQ